jgi:hypothetical protein
MLNPLTKNAPQMTLVEWNHEIQALAPYGSHQSLTVGLAFGDCGGVIKILKPNPLSQLLIQPERGSTPAGPVLFAAIAPKRKPDR